MIESIHHAIFKIFHSKLSIHNMEPSIELNDIGMMITEISVYNYEFATKYRIPRTSQGLSSYT